MNTSFQLQFSLYELHRIENCLCVIKLSLAHFYVEVSAVLKILDKTFNHMHPNSSTFECTKFEAEMDFISMSCSKSMRSSYASNRDIWRDSSWHFLKLLIRLCGDARHTHRNYRFHWNSQSKNTAAAANIVSVFVIFQSIHVNHKRHARIHTNTVIWQRLHKKAQKRAKKTNVEHFRRNWTGKNEWCSGSRVHSASIEAVANKAFASTQNMQWMLHKVYNRRWILWNRLLLSLLITMYEIVMFWVLVKWCVCAYSCTVIVAQNAHTTEKNVENAQMWSVSVYIVWVHKPTVKPGDSNCFLFIFF